MNPISNPTPPLRVLIVEDQIVIRHNLEHFLRQQPGFTVVGVCGSVMNARTMVHLEMPDLVLLDIGLPDGTGFDLLDDTFPAFKTKVIFLTAHNEYAIRAVRYGAIDYLLKPFDEQELTEALQRVTSAQPLLRDQINIALQSLNKLMRHDKIALRSQEFVKIVEVKDICYLQADNGCTTVFLHDGKKVVITRFLNEYEKLLSDRSFIRTHQSYLANGLYFDTYHPKEGIVYLKDGTPIPVSDRKKDLIENYFKNLK
jgi:two-component system LytT family response regulator